MQTAFAPTRETKHRWGALYNGATNDPSSWQRQLPNALKALIDESLDGLESWLDNTHPCTMSI